MSSGPSVASASVLIKPDLTGFKAGLQTGVNDAISTLKIKPVKVPLVPGTKTALRTAVNEVTGSVKPKPIVVPLVPTPATTLQREVDGVVDKVKPKPIVVPVTAKATGLKASVDTASGKVKAKPVTVLLQASTARFRKDVNTAIATVRPKPVVVPIEAGSAKNLKIAAKAAVDFVKPEPIVVPLVPQSGPVLGEKVAAAVERVKPEPLVVPLIPGPIGTLRTGVKNTIEGVTPKTIVVPLVAGPASTLKTGVDSAVERVKPKAVVVPVTAGNTARVKQQIDASLKGVKAKPVVVPVTAGSTANVKGQIDGALAPVKLKPLIVPVTVGSTSKVKGDIDTAVRSVKPKPVAIPVTVSTTNVKKDIDAAVRAAKVKPVTVKLVVDKTALKTGVDSATKSVKAKTLMVSLTPSGKENLQKDVNKVVSGVKPKPVIVPLQAGPVGPLQKGVNKAVGQVKPKPVIVGMTAGSSGALTASVDSQVKKVKPKPVKVTMQASPAGLQTSVNTAVASVKAPPIVAPVTTGPVARGTAPAVIPSGGGVVPPTIVPNVPRSTLGGIRAAAAESNALRGALIGLSHVTPVTVFGLGVYGTAALAAGLAIKSAIGSTADFEHQLNIFKATVGATDDEMVQIEKTAKALGADLTLPNTSAGDAARALTELAKAGLSVQDSLDGVRGTLQLAAAAQLDVGSAAVFVATELNAFGLAGNQATHVADLLAGASIAAQGDIQDFGTAFQQVSAVSHQVDFSLESTTGALTELAKAGLRGADGGTSLRTTLLRLAPTTKQAAEFQRALGIQIDNNASIGQQLPDLLDQYKRALEALTPVQQQQALAQIFGQDAIRAASILIRGGSDALRDNTDAANQNGAAARLAAANAEGLSGAFSGLGSNLDTLSINLGEIVKGPLTDLVTGLSTAVGGANDLTQALKDLNAVKVGPIKIGPIVIGPIKFADLPGGDFTAALRQKLKDALKLGAVGATFGPGGAEALRIKSLIDQIVNQISPPPTAGEKAIAEAKKRNESFIKDLQGADTDFVKGIHDESKRFGDQFKDALKIHDESRLAPGGLPPLSDAQKKAIQARVKAAAAGRTAAGGADLEVKIPIGLQSAQIDAQIAGNTKAEVAVDKKIIKFLEDKRERFVHNKARYVAIGKQLLAAKQELTSVLKDAGGGGDIQIPLVLQNAQLDAQIAGNLQQELRTDQKVVNYFTKLLERAKGNIARYNKVALALNAATDARDAVLNTIQSKQKEADQKQQDILNTRRQNRQSRLEIAASDAGGVGPAERALIAFYKRQAENTKLPEAERLNYLKALKTEQKNFAATVAAAAKAQIDLRRAILDLALTRAETLTPDDPRDDEKRLNQRLEFERNQLKKFGKWRTLTIDQKNEVIKIENTITDLKGRLLGLSGKTSGPSLADLFAESQKELADFGSNVAASVQTPASIRRTFAASIAIQNPNITAAQQQQISEAATTNDLLTAILAALKQSGQTHSPVSPGKAARNDPRPGRFEDPVGLATALRTQRLIGLG